MPPRIDPEQAVARMRAAGAEPIEPYVNADTPWRSRCLTCGRIITPRLSGMSRKRPCKWCGQARTAESHRHDAARAEAGMREMGLEPLEDYPGRAEPWLCRCLECGHEFTTSYRGRAQAVCTQCPPDRRFVPTRVPETRTPVDPKVAEDIMRSAGYEPLVPYPGRVEAPWPCRCTRCKHESTPRLSVVRRGSRCRICSSKAPGARHMAANAAAAAELMREAGFEPLEPYPGTHAQWRCRCTRCGKESTPRHASVRKGTGCRHCWRGAPAQLTAVRAAAQRSAAKRRLDPDQAAAVMRAAGLEPLTAYPGNSGTPWPGQCTTCDREVSPSYDSVKAGHGCKYCAATARGAAQRGIPTALRRASAKAINPAAAPADGREKRRPLSAEEAEKELRAAGFEPTAPYPGRISAPWLSRCVKCGTERRSRLIDIRRRGSGCGVCANKVNGPATIAANAAAAIAAMRAAGFEPIDDYPGSARPWRSRCMHCGKESTPRHANVKKGHGCKHCWGGTRL